MADAQEPLWPSLATIMGGLFFLRLTVDLGSFTGESGPVRARTGRLCPLLGTLGGAMGGCVGCGGGTSFLTCSFLASFRNMASRASLFLASFKFFFFLSLSSCAHCSFLSLLFSLLFSAAEGGFPFASCCFKLLLPLPAFPLLPGAGRSLQPLFSLCLAGS